MNPERAPPILPIGVLAKDATTTSVSVKPPMLLEVDIDAQPLREAAFMRTDAEARRTSLVVRIIAENVTELSLVVRRN